MFSETGGLWTFDGETGMAVPALLPNRIVDSEIRLEAFTASSSATPAVVADAQYTDDVPANFLFPDGSLDSDYFALAKSVRLNTSSDRRTANALRMPLVGLDGDFTVEWFVHSETNIGDWVNGLLAGVSHVDETRNPVWQLDAYLNGSGNVRTNGTTEKNLWLGGQPSGRTLGTSDAWHHCALVHVREGGVCRFYLDYRLVNTSQGLKSGRTRSSSSRARWAWRRAATFRSPSPVCGFRTRRSHAAISSWQGMIRQTARCSATASTACPVRWRERPARRAGFATKRIRCPRMMRMRQRIIPRLSFLATRCALSWRRPARSYATRRRFPLPRTASPPVSGCGLGAYPSCCTGVSLLRRFSRRRMWR